MIELWGRCAPTFLDFWTSGFGALCAPKPDSFSDVEVLVNKCSVCCSVSLDAVNAALVAGVSFRKIEVSYGVSKSAVERHANGCMGELLAAARSQNAVASGGKIDAELVLLATETRKVLEVARESKDWALALRCVARLEQQLAIRARLEDGGAGDVVNVAVTVNLSQSDDWLRLRAIILQAVPDVSARLALCEAIEKGGF